MICILIRPHLNLPPLQALLKNAAQATLRLHRAERNDLTIVISDDEEVQTLNRDFRGVDAPTDVLAFPADERDPRRGRRYLGDIILSWPRLAQQAAEYGHSPSDEAQLLVVHAVLHLLGYDHDNAEAKARMWEAQDAVLDQIGLGQQKTTLRP
jgi:probable rRNA maturation factor